MSWLSIIAAILKGIAIFLGLRRDTQIRGDGAAAQRANDYENEIKRDVAAADAGRNVGGLRDEQTDPNNRDNLK